MKLHGNQYIVRQGKEFIKRIAKALDRRTKDTAFCGRRKAKRVRVRKLQRDARRAQR